MALLFDRAEVKKEVYLYPLKEGYGKSKLTCKPDLEVWSILRCPHLGVKPTKDALAEELLARTKKQSKTNTCRYQMLAIEVNDNFVPWK